MPKLLLLILLSTTIFASSEAILKLDTQGHTGMIRDVLVSKDKSEIISASDDKTIRVWDAVTGKEKRKILGNIGGGSEGKIFAIALSANNSYLAVGGYLNNNGDYEYGNIRIYNYKTGKIVRLLKSHTSTVVDLSFSSDDKYLISSSVDKTVKIWQTSDWTPQESINVHTDSVYAVKMIKRERGYDIYSSGYDKKIALHRYENKTLTYISSNSANDKVQNIASNGVDIAVNGFGKEILIFDRNLNFKKAIKSETVPIGLAYSPDGKSLVAGTSGYPFNVNVYETATYTEISSFKRHTNSTLAVDFIDNNTLVSACSYDGIYVWDKRSTEVITEIAGVGESVWSVGIRGDTVAWGTIGRDIHNETTWEVSKSINLKDFTISDKVINQDFSKIKTRNGAWSLEHKRGGDYNYRDAVLEIKKDGVVQASVVKSSRNGLEHMYYGWYKDFIISSGASGFIKIYNKEGHEVASLVGHTGVIWHMALEGDRLVSGSDDQTLILWDLSSLDARSENLIIHPTLSLFISKENEFVAWTNSGYFTSSVGGDKYVGYYINQGADKEAIYVGSDKYFDTLYRPDILKYAWETGSEKKAIAFANRTKKVQKVDVVTSLPPIVYLKSDTNIKTSQDTTTISFSVESKEKVEEIIITLNGKSLNTRALKRKAETNIQTIVVDLEDGENIVSLKARNQFAMSDEVLVNIKKIGKPKDIYKPTLYLLSIGVSRYENPEYNLGVADKDALSMTKMFQSQKGKIYKDVISKTLINEKASSGNILDALDWIDKEVTSKDVAIIFIAGHGVNDEKGNYYFLSTDANLENLRRSAVKWSEIQDTIQNLPSKVILLADTCHSGDITGSRRDITSAVKSIINSGSGSIIMTATTGSGYSYEQKDWGHGAFTLSFLDGLEKAKADYDKDGTITIKEIDLYVTSRVKEMTKGKQKPTTIIPNSVPDFAIGVR